MWDIRVTDAVDHSAVDQSLYIQELCTSFQSPVYVFVAMVLYYQNKEKLKWSF